MTTTAGIPPADQWGLWMPGLDPAEYRDRLRSLRSVARLMAGPRATDLCTALEAAEIEPDSQLPEALAALGRLAPLDRRRILSSYTPLLQRTPRKTPNTHPAMARVRVAQTCAVGA